MNMVMKEMDSKGICPETMSGIYNIDERDCMKAYKGKAINRTSAITICYVLGLKLNDVFHHTFNGRYAANHSID